MTGLSATFLISYLLGSVSFAILVSRLRGLSDPRSYGSGNPGATNMLRTGDKRAAALTLLGDAAKGWMAIMVFHSVLLPGAVTLEEANEWLAVAAIAVFLGHLFPVFFQFKGGKGVATALGVLLGLSPLLGLASLAVWVVVFGLTRISSLSALSAALAAPLLPLLGLGYGSLIQNPEGPALALTFSDPVWWAIVAMSVLLLARHRRNFQDLLQGKEKPVFSDQDSG
jgi:acyl phosphate:glycerol-3-phosphate acyltransferase